MTKVWLKCLILPLIFIFKSFKKYLQNLIFFPYFWLAFGSKLCNYNRDPAWFIMVSISLFLFFPFSTVESGSTRKGCPTEQEKRMLHEEFLSVMQDKFMRGEEEEFDYSAVDTNDEYDDLTIRGRDEEEQYFDSEEMSNA